MRRLTYSFLNLILTVLYSIWTKILGLLHSHTDIYWFHSYLNIFFSILKVCSYILGGNDCQKCGTVDSKAFSSNKHCSSITTYYWCLCTLGILVRYSQKCCSEHTEYERLLWAIEDGKFSYISAMRVHSEGASLGWESALIKLAYRQVCDLFSSLMIFIRGHSSL